MRFVRAFTHMQTGELQHIREQEMPFSEDEPPIHVLEPLPEGGHRRHDFDMHELGLAEHFDALHAVTGAPCSPAAHLFQRLEAVPAAPPAAGLKFKRFRAKAGHEAAVPVFHEVPTTVAGILDQLRMAGPSAVPERVGYWLHFMGVLTDADMNAAGLKPLPMAVAFEFDGMRVKRDPSVGSRLEFFKRKMREGR